MNRLNALVDIIGRHAPEDGTYRCALPGVTLIRASSPTMPMPVIYTPTLCLVAQGTKEARLGETAYRYDAANYLIASVELPVMGSVIEATAERPYLCLQLDFDMTALSELAIRYSAPLTDAQAAPSGIMLNKTTPELLDAAIRLASLLDTPQDIDALAPLTLSEILYRLLSGPQGDVIRHMAQGESRLNQIARSIIWIRTHFGKRAVLNRQPALPG